MKKKHQILKNFAKEFNGREYHYAMFSKEEMKQLKENGIVILYGESDDLCELDGAIYDEGDCWLNSESSFVELPLSKNGFHEVDNKITHKIKIFRKDGCWDYKISGLTMFSNFVITEDGKPYCVGKLFYKDDLMY